MYYEIAVSGLGSFDDPWWENEENILLIMILLSSKNFSLIKLLYISFTLQGQKRQLKIGLQVLRRSERTRFLKKLFERLEHIQKW